MKKIVCFVITILLLHACSSEVQEIKTIPITSDSEAAQSLMAEFLLNAQESREYLNEALMDSILKLDPDFVLAKAYNNFGTNTETRENFLSAYENKETVSEIEAGIIETFYRWGIQGNINNANVFMDSLITKYPDYYELHLFSGDLKNRLKNSHGAKKRWEKAAELNPNSFNAYYSLSTLHYPTGFEATMLPREERDLDEAKKLLEKCAEILPDSYVPFRFLGNVYRAQSDFENSLKSYNASMELVDDKESDVYANLLLMVGHVNTFQASYEAARDYYRSAIDISEDWWIIQISTGIGHTYLYEKKYNQAISEYSRVKEEIKTFDKDDLTKLKMNYFLGFQEFLTLGHSQNQDETFQTVKNLEAINDDILTIELANAINDNQKQRIKLNLQLENKKMDIWFNILFGEYEIAREQMADYEDLTNRNAVFNSTATNEYKMMQGYLNLMEGNLMESIQNYESVAAEVISDDNYHRYFYALAKKASGDIEGSKKIFIELANDNFFTWQNAIVKNLAKDQIRVNI